MNDETGKSNGKERQNWGAEKRLQFIEFKAFWEGSVNRRNIKDVFAVSSPQASADLADYQRRAPGNLVYDSSAKRYVASTSFVPHFVQPDTDEYLSQLRANLHERIDGTGGWLGLAPEVDSIPLPTRPVDRKILRQLLSAIRKNASLEIEYHSMNPDSPIDKWRRVSPHAFAFDGFRWHVRAWCHRGKRFKDFLLSRCCGARRFAEAGAMASQDRLWHEHLSVTLVPNPGLTPSQKRAVELDYGMRDKAVVVRVRLALLYYFDKHVNPSLPGVHADAQPENARRRPIVVRNAAAYMKALKQVGATKAV